MLALLRSNGGDVGAGSYLVKDFVDRGDGLFFTELEDVVLDISEEYHLAALAIQRETTMLMYSGWVDCG